METIFKKLVSWFYFRKFTVKIYFSNKELEDLKLKLGVKGVLQGTKKWKKWGRVCWADTYSYSVSSNNDNVPYFPCFYATNICKWFFFLHVEWGEKSLFISIFCPDTVEGDDFVLKDGKPSHQFTSQIFFVVVDGLSRQWVKSITAIYVKGLLLDPLELPSLLAQVLIDLIQLDLVCLHSETWHGVY